MNAELRASYFTAVSFIYRQFILFATVIASDFNTAEMPAALLQTTSGTPETSNSSPSPDPMSSPGTIGSTPEEQEDPRSEPPPAVGIPVPTRVTQNSESTSETAEQQGINKLTGIYNRVVSLASGNDVTQPSEQTTRPWKTTLFRFGALSGLCGLALAICSILASLGILVGSRNAPTSSWSLEPSAYLGRYPIS